MGQIMPTTSFVNKVLLEHTGTESRMFVCELHLLSHYPVAQSTVLTSGPLLSVRYKKMHTLWSFIGPIPALYIICEMKRIALIFQYKSSQHHQFQFGLYYKTYVTLKNTNGLMGQDMDGKNSQKHTTVILKNSEFIQF